MHSKEVTNPKGLVLYRDYIYVYYGISNIFRFILSMMLMRGSGSGFGVSGQDRPRLNDDQIKEIITIEVVASVWGLCQRCLGLSRPL